MKFIPICLSVVCWNHRILKNMDMNLAGGDLWTGSYAIPDDTWQLDFVFHDSSNRWDNNNGQDWNVIVLGERHLHRMLRDYIRYYHEDRCHLSLEKDCPMKRPTNRRPDPKAKIIALPRVGGLHHRYEWRSAA